MQPTQYKTASNRCKRQADTRVPCYIQYVLMWDVFAVDTTTIRRTRETTPGAVHRSRQIFLGFRSKWDERSTTASNISRLQILQLYFRNLSFFPKCHRLRDIRNRNEIFAIEMCTTLTLTLTMGQGQILTGRLNSHTWLRLSMRWKL